MFCNATDLNNINRADEIAIDFKHIGRKNYLEILSQALAPVPDQEKNMDVNNSNHFDSTLVGQARVRVLPPN